MRRSVPAALAVVAAALAPPARAQDAAIVSWGVKAGDSRHALETFAGVAIGSEHTLGLRPDGTLAAWGRNDFGRCSVGAPPAGTS